MGLCFLEDVDRVDSGVKVACPGGRGRSILSYLHGTCLFMHIVGTLGTVIICELHPSPKSSEVESYLSFFLCGNGSDLK